MARRSRISPKKACSAASTCICCRSTTFSDCSRAVPQRRNRARTSRGRRSSTSRGRGARRVTGGGLAIGPDQKADPTEYHRRRQPLSHRQIQREQPQIAVGLARELDGETEHAVADQEARRYGTARARPGRVQPQQNEQHHALKREFVKLRRVPWLLIDGRKYH